MSTVPPRYLVARRSYGRPKSKPQSPLAPPVPRPFDFGFTERRPLVPMRAVTMFLNKNSRDILSLIEDGKLRWAFDIRSARATRREVRVLRQSLFEFTGLYQLPETPASADAEWRQIINLVLPPGIVVSPNAMPGRAGGRAQKPSPIHLKMRLPADSVQNLLFPREAILQGTEIAQCFSCDNQHITNLIAENSLHALNLRRGPKASPLVTRASVVEFLKQRRMS
jgi:hypothetical protein